MAYKVGEIILDIKADTAKLVKGMDNAQKAIKNTTSKIKTYIGTIIAAWATLEATIGASKLANNFIDTAASFEQMNVALKTLTGSAQNAQKAMDWILNFSTKTPYQINQVTEAFIRLKAYGLDATKDLKVLGDTASAMGKPLMQAVEAIADAVNGEFERLKEFGIKGYQQGQKVALQWVDASGKVKNIVIENNAKIIESTLKAIWNSKYGGAMEEQSKTWIGLISNIKDNWTKFQLILMNSGVFNYLKAIVSVIKDKIDNALKNNNGVIKTWGHNIIEAIKSIVRAFSGILERANELKIGFLGIKLVWLSFKEGVLTGVYAIEVAIRNMYNQLAKIHNLIPGLKKWEIVNPIKGWYGEALIENTKKIQETWKELKEALSYTAPSVESFLDKVEVKFKKFNTTTATSKKNTQDLTKELSKFGVVNDGIFKGFTNENTTQQLQKAENLLLDLQAQLADLYNNPIKILDIWYKKQKQYIQNTIQDVSKQKTALNLLNEIYAKKKQKIFENILQDIDNLLPQNWEEQIKQKYEEAFKAIQYLPTDKQKEIAKKLTDAMNKELAENNPFNKALQQLLNSNSLNDFARNFAKTITVALGGSKELASIAGSVATIGMNVITTMFEDSYNRIRDEYKNDIENLKQETYTHNLRATAYNAFGYQGQGQLESIYGQVSNINMLKDQVDMSYRLMDLAKQYKQATQDTIEVLSIAAGAAAAVYFDGGAVLQGIEMAIKAQDWAEQATGFKTFQQQYIQAVEQFKQAIRDLANNLIQLAGNVYKSISEYRSLYDKVTGTTTYADLQKKEAIDYLSQYTTDFSQQGLANFITEILQQQKDFVEQFGQIDTETIDTVIQNPDILNQYGLAIDSLNDKFKNSLQIVSDLIIQQNEANSAISDYVEHLKGVISGTTQQTDLKLAQQDFVEKLQQYYSGEIDANTLLDSAKNLESLGSYDKDLMGRLASTLQNVTQMSTEDYIQNIYKTITKQGVALPDVQIDQTTSPEEETLDVIKDTKSFVEQLLDLFSNGLFSSVPHILQDILDAITNIFSWLTGVLEGILGGITSIINSSIITIVNTITNISKTILNGLQNLGQAIVNGVVTGLGNVLAGVKNIGNFVFDISRNIVGFAGGAIESVGNIVGSISHSIGSSISSAFRSVGHIFGFAEGGYTGYGIGQKDQTGEIVAGIVHAGEWVAPKWMVDGMPQLFNVLEQFRLNKQLPQFAQGGFTTYKPSNNIFYPTIDFTPLETKLDQLIKLQTIQTQEIRKLRKEFEDFSERTA